MAFTVIVVGVSYAMGLAAAQLVNTEFRGQRWFRTLFLVPYAMPVYVAVIAWSFMLDRDNGALNALLGDLHLVGDTPPFWLIGSNAFWSIVMTTVWRLWPFAFLMMLAGMQNIPQELYEAAAVDGATPCERFRHITLPLLRPVTGVLMIILFLWTFNEFNTAYVLFGPAPPKSADLLSLHIYVNSFVNLNFGLGSAMSVMLLLFLLVVTMAYVRCSAWGVSALRKRSLGGKVAPRRRPGDPVLRHALPALHDRDLVAQAARRRALEVPLDPDEPHDRAVQGHLEDDPARALLREQPDRLGERDGHLRHARDLRGLRDLALPLPRAHGVQHHGAVDPDVPGDPVPAAAVRDLREHRAVVRDHALRDVPRG